MSHYKSNLRDSLFNLFEVFGREEVLGKGRAEDLDRETVEAILGEIETLATTKLAEPFSDDDRNPPVYDQENCSVAMSKEFSAAFKAWMDSDFWRIELPASIDGQPTPPSIRWSAVEMVLGANPAVYMFSAGPKFAEVAYDCGTDRDKKIAQHVVDRQWGGTMVLTEPDAGSDVGAGRTKAFLQEDGTWHIEGVKRFITNGDQDMTENIIHFVLARPANVEGVGGPGTKGLSLFLVPKWHFDLETGELTGERNGVYATNLEKKMGLKVSTTCQMTFGEKEPAVGYLLGEVHDGIHQMFKVIEHARMMVGTKAIGTLSTGYLNALEYAKERVQGGDIAKAADKTAPRVTIINHPDVRRSLMTQKSFAEGMRLLVQYTATFQDQLSELDQVKVWNGEFENEADEMASDVNDLLLPIVKGYGSERSWVLLGTESLQTYGGSGFLMDYPVEQYVRDAKIDTLYEGTTAIQGQDLLFRKIVKNNFKALGFVTGEVMKFVEHETEFEAERAQLGKAVEEVGKMLAWIGQQLQASVPGSENHDPKAIYKVGLNSTRLLMALGDVVVAWLLLRAATVAKAKLADAKDADDKAFLEGKIASGQWFAAQVLPKLGAERRIAEATTLDVMELDEAAF